MKATGRVLKWLFFLGILPGAIGVAGWQGWSWWSWASAPAGVLTVEPGSANPQSTPALVRIDIPQGTSAEQIGADLKAAGLIRSTEAWDLWTRLQVWRNREGGFQAGTYEISSGESLESIANQIWQGEVIQESFTIPEGWSLQQMAEYFQEKGWFSAQEFLAAAEQVPRSRYPWLPENLPKVEGFLFPDTYRVSGETTPSSVINQMLDRFQQVALPLYQRSNGQSPYSLLEWVTLASIVEKEAVVDVERPTIAAVFARRLRESMPLGADPTVEYGLGIRQTVDRPLTYAQVATPSPYNTYIHPGLPPTPISSPGLASLEVSLNPSNTEYLYFMARYDGTHIFSRTLAEHEAAKVQVDRDLQSQRQDQGQTGQGPAGTAN